MAFKTNANPQGRGFFWAPSGDDRESGLTPESAKQSPQSAIDAATLIVPPPSGAQPALVTASQGGASNQGFVLQDGIAFTALESSFILSQPIAITMASALSCRITTVVNLQDNSTCVLFNSLISCAINASFMGVNGANAVGLQISGNCDDIFCTISQLTIASDNAIGILIDATSPTPVDLNMNTVVIDGDNSTFFDYNPQLSTDIAVISISSVVDNGSVGVTGFLARNGTLIIEISGLIDCSTAIRVLNGATVDIFDAMIVGDIIVESGGTLNCRILSHTAGSITNNGTINGVINEERFGTAIISEPLSTVVYVDGGTTETDPNGSANQPFATIQAALDSITDASAVKHYTILAAPGTYTQSTTTLKPFTSIECIGDKRELILNGDIVVDTAGDYVVSSGRINGNLSVSVAGLGLTIFKLNSMDVLGTTTIDGDGAGNTSVVLREAVLFGISNFDNCTTLTILTDFRSSYSSIGSAGSLDSDGNTSRLVADSCQFNNNAINISGPLQARAAFFGSNIEGILTADGSLTQITFDAVSYPQNFILTGSATEELNSEARGTKYDPSASVLSSTNVQDAIDEIAVGGGDPVSREIIINGVSLATSQVPGGTDTPLQIEFGAAQVAVQFDLDVNGVATCNISGQYDFQMVFHVGRMGSTGASEVFIRLLVNGTQVGISAFTLIDDDDTIVPLEFFAHLTLVASDLVTFEVVRDSSGSDSGGLFEGTPTLGDWNDSPTASMLISQLTGTVDAGAGDVIGGNTSLPDEIVTYDGLTGKIIKDGAGVTVISGTLKRTTLNADLNIEQNGSGEINVGNYNFRGPFLDLNVGEEMFFQQPIVIIFKTQLEIDALAFTQGKMVYNFDTGRLMQFSDGISMTDAVNVGNMSGPTSSVADEIPTFANADGDVLQASSDISALAGDLFRAGTNLDLRLTRNGTGSVQFGSGNILGEFGVGDNTAGTIFSVATILAGNSVVQFEHNGSAIGSIGYINVFDNLRFADSSSGKGIHIESNDQISIGDRIDEPDFSVIIGSFTDPFGLPQLTTAQEGSITGRPRMIHYNSILESIRYFNLLDGEFQSLLSAPGTFQLNEIPTFSPIQGHKLEAVSDVSIVGGVMERITNNQGFRINRSGTGVVQLGAGSILGEFGVVDASPNVRFSVASNAATGSMFITFEQNSTTVGIIGFVDAENTFGISTADGGGVFVEGGRTFIGIIPDTIPAGVACKIGSSGINTMMVPEIGQVVENILTGVQSMFHYNTTLNVLRYHDNVGFKTVAHTGVTAYFESGGNSTDTSLTSVNSYQIMNHGGGLSLLEGEGWEVSPGDSNRMRWSGTGTWSGVCRSIFEIRNPDGSLVRNYDSRPFVNGVASGQFWSLHNVAPINDDPRIIEYETHFTISPGQEFDTRIKIKSGGTGSSEGARIFNATYDFRRFQ